MITYCLDCGKQLSKWAYRNKNIRCGSCANKMLRKDKSTHPNWKGGISLIQHYCSCGNKVSSSAYLRCRSCAAKELYKNTEYRAKILQHLSGSNNPMYGKKHSKETRVKISIKAGGDGTLVYPQYPYGPGWTYELKEAVRTRDNYTCQICGITNDEHLLVLNTSLPIHHIDYNKKNNSMNNLIALCSQCHSRTNFDRPYWKELLYGKLVQPHPVR